ncbi:MAG: SDR family oxidoreductase [Planktomarina sp.]|nr:SDR family oxidoreductase [Planktomarina sp.]
MSKILVLGAYSAIARSCCTRWAEQGEDLFLVGKSADRLDVLAKDLSARGAGEVSTYVLNVLDYDSHLPMLNEADLKLKGIDTVLIAHGILPNQAACEQSFEHTKHVLEVNGLSTISLLTHLATYFEKRQKGEIAVISSVAGNRGRKSNYVYGASKGMVDLFLQGLRNRLFKSGVHVLTIKPGFVDTPMTKAFSKGPLWSTPEKVSSDIFRALHRRSNICYTPYYWRLIMFIICSVPESIFKRLNL